MIARVTLRVRKTDNIDNIRQLIEHVSIFLSSQKRPRELPLCMQMYEDTGDAPCDALKIVYPTVDPNISDTKHSTTRCVWTLGIYFACISDDLRAYSCMLSLSLSLFFCWAGLTHLQYISRVPLIQISIPWSINSGGGWGVSTVSNTNLKDIGIRWQSSTGKCCPSHQQIFSSK